MTENSGDDTVKIKLPSIFMQILNKHGPITVVAFILLAALLGWIPSPMTTMLNMLSRNVEALESHDRTSAGLRTQIVKGTEYQNILLRSICRSLLPKEQQAQCEPKYLGYEEGTK